MTEYDFIILGAGAAGLMLANAMAKDDFFSNKTILLIDKDSKKTNDRTWCFWEKGDGEFDTLVHKKWNQIYFASHEYSKTSDISPYTYKMIRGIDFYTTYLQTIHDCANIHFKQEKVNHVNDTMNNVIVTTDKGKYTSKKVLNSLFDYKMATFQKKYPVLQQHFIGWFVKSEKPIFKADRVTYMDFSVPQKGNTRFMYVLPFSKTEALIEYTLFSEKKLPEQEYEIAIKKYLKDTLDCAEYSVIDKEEGSIPMTCYDFSEQQTNNMRFIGTAGGWAKPSTGYTFMSTAKKTPQLIAYLKTGRPLQKLSFKNRFWYYDLLFLDVLKKNNGNGHRIFDTLFKKRKPQLVFEFLDEETSFFKELYYIWGSPKKPFTKALFRRIFS